ncbi:hypothetical protein ACIP5N_21565 [Streptomyces sp. NPDC088768]|uniref:hypothetical protein n=1 Tax=Streptomyces sp. NPDC088768 TaxID=3365894 RepID=UPI003828E249
MCGDAADRRVTARDDAVHRRRADEGTLMTAENPGEGHVRRAVTELTTVFENLGAEHQALKAQETTTSARERRGTVIRMVEDITQTTRTVASTIGTLATVHGLRSLGVSGQFSKDIDGHHYTPLPTLDSPAERLRDALDDLSEAATTLGKAYTPTKKHPSLAVARCPNHVKAALSSLRAALDAVCADLAADDPEIVEDHAADRTLLTELMERVCTVVPAQSGPSAEEVVAAIRSDPNIARAAAAALKPGT